ncbi:MULTISPECIES: major capsid protein [unclassified Bradyrhizobium]|uniref:major capsid protein n=1 Tax=unclassified Bradyrhizobium TaxID=2631580 RepID=UPI0028E96E70|nr:MULTISPECIES: major capsid protein [unclassified Bradyrhizobium]
MTETRLADMIVPTEFNNYVQVLSTQKSALFQSGIITDLTSVIDAEISGKTVNMPFFNDLDAADAEQVLDDNSDLTVSKTSTGQDVAVKLLRGKAFGASDLSSDLSGADPIQLIANRFAEWWNRRMQTALLATLAGAMGSAGMAANVNDISGLTGGAENFDADSFIDAAFLLGDEQGGLNAVAVHSLTLKAMVKADLIEFMPDSEGKLTIPTYMGKTVIVDDSMPVTGSGANRVFTTYIFGPGAIGYGEKSPKTPVEVERQALKGMGQEYIVQRRQWVMHPRGIKWLGANQVGVTPANSELADVANWQRVYDPKVIRIVAFKHKLGS